MEEIHRIILGEAALHTRNHILFLSTLEGCGLKSGRDISIKYPRLDGSFLYVNIQLVDSAAEAKMEKFLSSEIFGLSEEGLKKVVQPQIQSAV